ncbi:hypothetical protein N0B31_16975 [Salinirubellus salinus]|uniref:DUF7552 domain-containing protein n=1 Tax=Salinirubellus salinus TaxID=1364945 RepID=A0A9E7R383_9EURY|nr:hypothetical protein [Salinirubellus salinus]UWM53815.1 hypothetical protein N0B31_16975 [Salinirubellus salinus]
MPPASDESTETPAYESPLLRARDRVAALVADEGPFTVACAETGVSPPPVSDARFASFADAERARDAAVDYRTALRNLDPGLPSYDLAVCEARDTSLGFASVRETTADRRANGLPRTRRTVTLAGAGSDEWLRVENAPVVDLVGPETLLDDEVVERQLEAMGRER